MSSEIKKENKMGTMPMTRLILSMSLPAMFSMTMMAMYNVVDSIFIGNYDQRGLTAVSLAFPLQLLLIAASIGTAIGVNSLVSRKLGEKDFDMANRTATHGLMLCGFTFVFFLLLGLFAVKPFMAAFSDDPVVTQYGAQYLTIVLCFSLFSIIQVMVEKTLQATGNMIYPMLFQLLGAVVNIIFDPLLIYGVGFFPEFGVAGAAIATVFGQLCGMVFSVLILFRKNHEVQIQLKGFRFEKEIVKNIYAVGFPTIIMQSIGAVMMLGMNGIFKAAGSEVSVRVYGIYFKLQSFVFMPCFGLNQGVMPVIGYNYGARNKKRMYGALKTGIVIALIIMMTGTLLMWLIPDVLISMFGGDAQLMEKGEYAFRIISLCFTPAAVGIMFTTLFQATGKGLFSLMMSFARQLVLILPIAYLLWISLGVDYVWYAFPVAEVGSLILAVCFFMYLAKKDYKKLDVHKEAVD